MNLFGVFTDSARCKPALTIQKLAARRQELRTAEHEAIAARRDAATELEQAQEAVRTADARALALGGHAAEQKKAAKRLADAEAALPAADDRLQQLKGALAVIDQEGERIAKANAADIRAELTQDGQAAADALKAAFSDAAAARERIRAEWARAQSVLGVIDPDSLRYGLPVSLPPDVDDLAREAGRAVGRVRAPLDAPPASEPAQIAPEHDPDPEIREAARAQILARKGVA